MSRIGALCIALMVMLLSAGAARAEVYKWVDKDGILHLSDQPPQDAGSAMEVETVPTYQHRSQPARHSSEEPREPDSKSDGASETITKAEQRKTPNVELYVTSRCPYCKKARDFFRSRGIPFTEYDIEKDKNAARRKRQLDSRKGVPFAVVNGHGIHGFSEAAYLRALEGT